MRMFTTGIGLSPAQRGEKRYESAGSLARRAADGQERGASADASRSTSRAGRSFGAQADARLYLARAGPDQAVTWMLSPGFITCTFTLGAMVETARRKSSPAWVPSTCGLWA